ncbi:MAG: DUF4974 domain-containing protein, partial [Pyrinomonadaceae bacterium]|nr:DUF4974 domain-containing protein [Sphingobacteriaceae bacterium]
SIKITKDKASKILTPGQQAQFDSLGVLRIKENVNIESVIAWKNGLFNFSKADIKDVMNQLARWYDIDIRYEGTITNQVYEGEMQRDLKLSQVLKLLGRSGVHFKIENNTLVVMP